MRHIETLLALLILSHIGVSYTVLSGSFGLSRRLHSLFMSSTENPLLAKNIVIPEDKLVFSYARCSGPGAFLYLLFFHFDLSQTVGLF